MAFPTGWERKAAITIDNTKVSGTSGSLSNFPVLITEDMLPSEMFDSDGANPAQNGGGDVRFSSDSAGSSQLAIEVVSFVTDADPANGSAEIWVKVPTLSKGADTTVYVWYKTSGTDSQPAVTNTYGRNAVWSDYGLVTHDNTVDSAGNNSDATRTGTITTQSAKIGDGDYLGTDADLYFGSDASINNLTDFYVSGWFQLVDDETGFILGGLNGEQGTIGNFISVDIVGTESGRPRIMLLSNVGSLEYWFPSGAWNAGDWTHLVVQVENGVAREMYVDGVQKVSASEAGGLSGNTETGVVYAKRVQSGGDTPDPWVFDEVRIGSSIRDTDWISTEYANQNDPATFASAGTPEAVRGDFEESLSLAATSTVSTTNLMQANNTLGIAGVSDLNNQVTAEFALSLGINGVSDLQSQSFAEFINNVSFDGLADDTLDTSIIANDTMSVTGIADISASLNSQILEALNITGQADITTDNFINISSVLNLGGLADTGVSSNIIANALITIDANSFVSFFQGNFFGENLVINANASTDFTNSALFNPELLVGALSDLSNTTSLTAGESLDLNTVADINQQSKMTLAEALGLDSIADLDNTTTLQINAALTITAQASASSLIEDVIDSLSLDASATVDVDGRVSYTIPITFAAQADLQNTTQAELTEELTLLAEAQAEALLGEIEADVLLSGKKIADVLLSGKKISAITLISIKRKPQ